MSNKTRCQCGHAENVHSVDGTDCFGSLLCKCVKYEPVHDRIADLESALAAARERGDKLAEALEPFAACAGVWDDNEKESQRVIHVSRQGVKGKPDLVLTVGDLLDAYTALLDWRTARGAK